MAYGAVKILSFTYFIGSTNAGRKNRVESIIPGLVNFILLKKVCQAVLGNVQICSCFKFQPFRNIKSPLCKEISIIPALFIIAQPQAGHATSIFEFLIEIFKGSGFIPFIIMFCSKTYS